MIVTASTTSRRVCGESVPAFLRTISTILLVDSGLGKQPTLIRYLRCLAQLKNGPPPPASAGEQPVRRWLDRHRSIGRGDWDSVLRGILGLDAAPSPPATETASKAGPNPAAAAPAGEPEQGGVTA